MKCPYCGSFCMDNTLYCPNCKQPLPTGQSAVQGPKPAPVKEKRSPLHKIGILAITIASICALGVGV